MVGLYYSKLSPTSFTPAQSGEQMWPVCTLCHWAEHKRRWFASFLTGPPPNRWWTSMHGILNLVSPFEVCLDMHSFVHPPEEEANRPDRAPVQVYQSITYPQLRFSETEPLFHCALKPISMHSGMPTQETTGTNKLKRCHQQQPPEQQCCTIFEWLLPCWDRPPSAGDSFKRAEFVIRHPIFLVYLLN